MTTTVYDVIRMSLKRIGVGSAGETLSAESINDGLTVLNQMLEAWFGNENLMSYAPNHYTYSLTPGTASVTIGPTGDLAGPRPTSVGNMYVLVDTVSYPMQELNAEQWSQIQLKSLQVSWPTSYYYDAQLGNGVLNLYPVVGTPGVLNFNGEATFAPYTTQHDTVSFPPGYVRAITYNLAVELADFYGLQCSPVTMQIASKSKKIIKRTNYEAPIQDSEATFLGRDDVPIPFAYIVGGNF